MPRSSQICLNPVWRACGAQRARTVESRRPLSTEKTETAVDRAKLVQASGTRGCTTLMLCTCLSHVLLQSLISVRKVSLIISFICGTLIYKLEETALGQTATLRLIIYRLLRTKTRARLFPRWRPKGQLIYNTVVRLALYIIAYICSP